MKLFALLGNQGRGLHRLSAQWQQNGDKCGALVPISWKWSAEKRRNFATMYTGAIKPGKLSYLSIPGEFPLMNKTMGQLLNDAVEKHGDADCIYFADTNERLSFAQVKQECEALAASFLKIGLKPGDRVGIWGPNSKQWYITEFAAAKAGLISVFINPAYQTRELLYSLNKVQMKAIVIAGNFKTQNYLKMVMEAVPELENSPLGNLKSKSVPSLEKVISMEATPPSKSVFSYNQLLADGQNKDNLAAMFTVEEGVQSDAVCNIQFTSGTTGNPKGVMLSHHNILNNSFLAAKRMGYTNKDKFCLTVPLFHCYGNVGGVLCALHVGATCVFPSPGFSPAAAIKTTAQEKCTVMYGTPTMHIDILNDPTFSQHDISSLRMALTAGSICPEPLVKEMKTKYQIDYVNSVYGLTETSPVAFQSLPQDCDTLRATTVGYPQEHTEIKIVDSQGQIVPIGAQGEMCMRGYLVMQGYWDDEAKTREAIDQARWFHSGDLFIMDASGHGRIVGRLKDMIIRGGENIYPKEVEEFLHTHPDIQEAQVFGVPDKRLGETVATWIRIKDGKSLTEDQVRAFCKGQISHFKIPQYIRFTTEFPKTTSGKIQKFQMRATAIKDYGLEG